MTPRVQLISYLKHFPVDGIINVGAYEYTEFSSGIRIRGFHAILAITQGMDAARRWRPVEIQWSDKPCYGKLIPQPSPSELDAFYDILNRPGFAGGSNS